MKKLTPNKLKAIYLLWLFLHFMLLVFSPYPFGEKDNGRDYHSFYPFISAKSYGGSESGIFFNHTEQYDITELIFYALAPLVLRKVVRMWRSDGELTGADDGGGGTRD